MKTLFYIGLSLLCLEAMILSRGKKHILSNCTKQHLDMNSSVAFEQMGEKSALLCEGQTCWEMFGSAMCYDKLFSDAIEHSPL